MNAGSSAPYLTCNPVHPATDSEEDARAAEFFDAWSNRAFLDPLFRGRYPEGVQGVLEPHIQGGDLDLIEQPVDFLGLNLYTRTRVRADKDTVLGVTQAPPSPDATLTDMGWEVYPDALYEQLMDLAQHYDNPTVFVTENGAAFPDVPTPDGRVEDDDRVAFFAQYLEALHRALSEGANVRGYFAWSLLDNFEWAEGYTEAFRSHLCRLRDAAPHAQTFLRVVSGGHSDSPHPILRGVAE